jgi:hypothetical protein
MKITNIIQICEIIKKPKFQTKSKRNHWAGSTIMKFGELAMRPYQIKTEQQCGLTKSKRETPEADGGRDGNAALPSHD